MAALVYLALVVFMFSFDSTSAKFDCTSRIDSGPCDAAFIRYGYNRKSQKCEEFVYGGCEGNKNRYDTMKECELACTVFVPNCISPLDRGPCRDKYFVYGFNKEYGKCQRFIYGGCLGNNNRYDTLEECNLACNLDYDPPSR